MNSNYIKGGLIGLAATAIGLMQMNCVHFLDMLLPLVLLHCTDDPEGDGSVLVCLQIPLQ
jgi:vacuole morphology and inheritance protein 14